MWIEEDLKDREMVFDFWMDVHLSWGLLPQKIKQNLLCESKGKGRHV